MKENFYDKMAKMKKKILITGVAGTGKSLVCKHLLNLGYNTLDIEDVKGLFEMYHKGTKKVFENYNNANPENIKNADWLCDLNKLKSLLKTQKGEIAFYCGIASNMDDVIPLFDKIFVLKTNPQVLNNRLKNREGTDNIGNNQEGRDIIFGWKDWWEEEMRKKGAIFVDANGTPDEIIKKILSLL